jgi:ribosomal-protein-alanine N-acetyltransferase
MQRDTLVLETQRLRLTPFTEADVTDRYVGWLNDSDVVRYSEQRHRRHDRKSCAEYFESMRNQYFCSIRLKGSDTHIGNISATVDSPNRTADLAILIGEKSAWGKGFGLEAWTAMMQYFLRRPAIRRVTGGCAANNAAMVAIMERAGMKHDFTRPRAFLIEGEEVDSVHYVAYSPVTA